MVVTSPRSISYGQARALRSPIFLILRNTTIHRSLAPQHQRRHHCPNNQIIDTKMAANGVRLQTLEESLNALNTNNLLLTNTNTCKICKKRYHIIIMPRSGGGAAQREAARHELVTQNFFGHPSPHTCSGTCTHEMGIQALAHATSSAVRRESAKMKKQLENLTAEEKQRFEAYTVRFSFRLFFLTTLTTLYTMRRRLRRMASRTCLSFHPLHFIRTHAPTKLTAVCLRPVEALSIRAIMSLTAWSTL